MAKSKQPKLGDRILHKEPAFGRENEGVVIEMLGMQFVYKTDSGEERFCLFREDWKIIKD
jgi:hypothetical protein